MQVVSVPSKPLVASVTNDGVAWNYAYTNLRIANSLTTYLYDRLTVTGPNGYNTSTTCSTSTDRNVISQITDSIGRVTAYDFDSNYRVTRIIYPEGNEVSVGYDGYGNITSRTVTPKPGSGLAVITETANYQSACLPSAPGGPLCYRPRVVPGCPQQADRFPLQRCRPGDGANRSGRRQWRATQDVHHIRDLDRREPQASRARLR